MAALIDGFSAEVVPVGEEADAETNDDGAAEEDDDDENEMRCTEATRFDEPIVAAALLWLLGCRWSNALLLVPAATMEDEEDAVCIKWGD